MGNGTNQFALPEGHEQLDLRDVQVVGYDILVAVDAFCKKHGLHVYLCGGTLLGAVRHKGFIPWDDDVDAFMSRPDYEKLIELSRTERIRDDLAVACWQNGGFYRPFMRIYRTDTCVQRNNLNKASGNMIWLDILPVDGLPNNKTKLRLLYQLRFILNKFNMITLWKPGKGPKKYLVACKLIAWPLAKVVGAKGWTRLLEAVGKSRPYEKYDHVGCFTGGRYGIGEIMPKAGYEKPTKIEFEGRKFDTMSCWKEYLTGIYGDYMTPPPENKRNAHLDFTSMPKKALKALREQYASMYK